MLSNKFTTIISPLSTVNNKSKSETEASVTPLYVEKRASKASIPLLLQLTLHSSVINEGC